MAIAGTLRYGGTSYYLHMLEVQAKTSLYLVSKLHKEDFVTLVTGEEKKHRVLDDVFLARNAVPVEYIVEALEQGRQSGILKVFTGRKILSDLLDIIAEANAYKFADRFIIRNEVKNTMGTIIRDFYAKDERMTFRYTKKNKFFTELHLEYGDVELHLSEEFSVKIPVRSVEFVEVKETNKKKASLASISGLDYETLGQVLDLSWYEKDGVLLKQYVHAGTIQELEERVMTPMLEEYKRCIREGREFVLGLDTETTGFIFYDLSAENQDLDDLVAIPISWQDDQGAVIFIDMEHFDNVPLDYAINRLRGFIEGKEGTIRIEKRKPFRAMSSFGGDWEVEEEVEVDRAKVNLVGHNTMFDGRVLYHYGVDSYWNNDTLQMAFNLNPKVAKGSNKLKSLTRRIFGHETPELDDILGKGNEDKYRLISDLRVAVLYGCADTDYTRLVFKKERSLMSDKMYHTYHEQDMRIMNILYKSEYYGMNTDEKMLEERSLVVEQDLELLKGFIYNIVGTVVDYRNQEDALEKQRDSGMITTEEMLARKKKIVPKTDAFYMFDIGSGPAIREVIYGIMGYPIKARTEKGLPSADKFAMDRLMRLSNPEGISNGLKEDLMSSGYKEGMDKKSNTLIDAKKYNGFKYPLSYALSVYAKLNKEWTSYYKPIREQNLEGKMFKNYSLARIETRRIMNPGQTMKGALKAVIKPYGPDWYLCDFDQSQVEYRIMASLAGFTEIIEKMRDPEKDYHIESASLVFGMPPYKVDRKTRKNVKGVSFGVPYGLGDAKMSNNLFGNANDDSLFETRKLLYTYKRANKPIIDMLEKYRTEALKRIDLPVELRKFIALKEEDVDKPYGMVRGLKGFYRLFDLSDMDMRKQGKVKRPAGNYPIQNFAAELFRMILLRFYDRCVKEGVSDKIIWHMTIHDELLFSVHKSVHPFYLYKLLYESCVVTIPGHTKYYIGINIGDSWADCKKDSNEAPIIHVKRTIDRWDAGEFREDDYWNHSYTFVDEKGKSVTYKGVKGYVYEHKQEYIKNRIGEVLKEIQPNVVEHPVDVKNVLENFVNYMVRSYVSDFYAPNYKANKDDDDDQYVSRLESWVIDYFGEGKEIRYPDGQVAKVKKGDMETEHELELTLGFDEEEDNDVVEYWSFDDADMGESMSTSFSSYVEDDDIDEYEEFLQGFDMSMSDSAKNVTDMMISKAPSYKNVRVINKQLIITVGRGSHTKVVKEKLLKECDDDGNEVLFITPLGRERWRKVRKEVGLAELDELVEGLKR